jgi:sorbitol-specific phosphotransferase system component IIC
MFQEFIVELKPKVLVTKAVHDKGGTIFAQFVRAAYPILICMMANCHTLLQH